MQQMKHTERIEKNKILVEHETNKKLESTL